MKISFLGIVLVALRPAWAALKADIRADTNRDGHVDLLGDSDMEGKTRWNSTHGALFLANIGDAGGRCADMSAKDYAVLAACHNADDDIQRAPQYMAPVRTVPIPGLSLSAVGHVSVLDPVAQKNVRIFRRDNGTGWDIVTSKTAFNACELSAGLELGIDARSPRMPGDTGSSKMDGMQGWDGRVTVHFNVSDGKRMAVDSVMLRVAPVLTHHHAQHVDTLFASEISLLQAPPSAAKKVAAIKRSLAATRAEVQASIRKAGVRNPLTLFDTDDLWTQDFFEPAYMSMPGPNGTVSMRIMVATPDKFRGRGTDAIRLLFTTMRRQGVGAVQHVPSRPGRVTSPQISRDAMGNLETIPPHEHNGRRYPAGRIIMGGNSTLEDSPLFEAFFAAQEMQLPVLVDSSWLGVGHVDEFLQFLPTNSTPRGWKLVVADPPLALQLLRDLRARGHGDGHILSHSGTGAQSMSIDALLDSQKIARANDFATERIAAAVDILRNQTGIESRDIIRVPALFKFFRWGRAARKGKAADMDWWPMDHVALDQQPAYMYTGSSNLRRREIRLSETLEALFPPLVNGIVLNGPGNAGAPPRYVAPKPWGPVLNGSDVFEDEARVLYGAEGFEVDFVDDWTYFRRHGDLHCATNTLRDAETKWW